ncbi:MAG: nitroreductase family protein [Chrysiogenales bacterium]|nr:MAG: nitroreductase family protein [Chrysiogenales bacterium]
MKDNEVITAIKARRSIRKYETSKIDDETIRLILDAGRWAPSGLNNQPWRFMIIADGETKKGLSNLTKYNRIVRESTLCIAVFYDRMKGYDRDKDVMAIGACIQNMLLAAHTLGVGTVWLGEILSRKVEAGLLLGAKQDFELMALISLGSPAESPRSSRKELESLIITPPEGGPGDR